MLWKNEVVKQMQRVKREDKKFLLVYILDRDSKVLAKFRMVHLMDDPLEGWHEEYAEELEQKDPALVEQLCHLIISLQLVGFQFNFVVFIFFLEFVGVQVLRIIGRPTLHDLLHRKNLISQHRNLCLSRSSFLFFHSCPNLFLSFLP